MPPKSAKAAVQYFLARAGYILNPMASRVDILRFVRKLQPVDCGVPLVRIGSQNDGGYLLPEDFEGIEYCFSPGVSDNVAFEEGLALRYGIRSFLADALVDGPPVKSEALIFDKKHLGVSNTESWMTMECWKEKYLPRYNQDTLLQMDIEGDEWQVLFNMSDTLLCQFRVMVVEFHRLPQMFCSPFFYNIVSPCFGRILQYFYVAHLHPNNYGKSVNVRGVDVPQTLEITFYNKKRVAKTSPVKHLPHPLDRDNNPEQKHKSLSRVWYAG